jgi:hypothetical protein
VIELKLKMALLNHVLVPYKGMISTVANGQEEQMLTSCDQGVGFEGNGTAF